jgi:hypothetical protein
MTDTSAPLDRLDPAPLNPDLPEWAEYADSFGPACTAGTERGQAIEIIDKLFQGEQSINPVVIADALVDAGLIANEFGPHRWRLENRPRADLIRRVLAYQDEANEMMRVLASTMPEWIREQDGQFHTIAQRLNGELTPPDMARYVANRVAQLRMEVVKLTTRMAKMREEAA